MSLLSNQLKALHSRKSQPPVWAGPEDDGSQGGITFSMLSRFLQCRERFRLLVVEGLKPVEQFNHRIEYGNMWHICEEAHAGARNGAEVWFDDLRHYATNLCARYRNQQQQVEHWYNVCRLQFPHYARWWASHSDIKTRTPLFAEKEFKAPIVLPSGRTVYLRGKIDSVDHVADKDNVGVWVMENKTKGRIDEAQLRRQLRMDLQTMIYRVAVDHVLDQIDPKLKRFAGPVRGVRYNVVRRPLSGGKGTITQHEATRGAKCPRCKEAGKIDGKPCPKCNGQCRIGAKPAETSEAYYARVEQYITDAPQDYFMRWNVEVSDKDVAHFKQRCLFPILENLCAWWDQVATGSPLTPWGTVNGMPPLHWQHPFGVRNLLDEGGSSDLDEALMTGSRAGLRRVDNLFPELKV